MLGYVRVHLDQSNLFPQRAKEAWHVREPCGPAAGLSTVL
jgi:hypothetical protein